MINKIIYSILSSIIMVMLYSVTYKFSNVEIIRNKVEDVAFDNLINPWILSYFGFGLSTKEEYIPDIPETLIVEIDDFYLMKHGLVNLNGESNYGYILPRTELAKIVTRLDEISDKLNLRAVFLDYDLTYTMLPGGKEFSNEDKMLLEVLSKARKYKVLIPANSITGNVFLEHLKQYPWIIPVSTSFSESSDGISRRFIAFDHGYPAASLMMYSLAKKCTKPVVKEDSVIVCGEEYYQNDIVENRLIAKSLQKNDLMGESSWRNMSVMSASLLNNLEYEPNKVKKGTMIFLGSTYQHAGDNFTTTNIEPDINGVEMHANAYMSHFYFDGKLKTFPFYWACGLIFLISLFINYIFDYNQMLKSTVILMGLMLFSSLFLLIYFKFWFNWFFPIIVFIIIESIEKIKYLRTKVSNGVKWLISIYHLIKMKRFAK